MSRIIIVILLFTIAFVSCSTKFVPIETGVMEEIEQLYASQKYDAVIAQLEPLLEKHQTDVKGHHTLIRCYAEKQQLEVVEARYKQAVEKHPKKAALWFALGYVYYRQGIQQNDQAKFQEAVKTIEKALELDTDIAIAHATLGSLFVFLKEPKDFDRGIEETTAAIGLTPPSEKSDIVKYYSWLGVAYTRKGLYGKALECYQQALKITQEIGDREAEAFRLDDIGDAYKFLYDYRKALEHYQQAMVIAQEIGDREWEAIYLRQIGDVYDSLNDYPKALEYYQQALAIIREISDRELEYLVLGSMGLIYESLGDYRTALECYQQALKITQEIGDREGEAFRLGSIGGVYEFLGDYPKALEYYQQALSIAQEIGDREGEAFRLDDIGDVYKFLGDYPKALEYYQQALSIAQEIGDREGEAFRLDDIGDVYKFLGDYPKALEYYQQALKIVQEIGDRKGEASRLISIGHVYHSMGDYRQALEYYQQALKITKEIGDRVGEAYVLGSMGRIYGILEELKEYPQEFDYLNQALQLSREIGIQPLEASILGLLGVTHMALKKFEQASQYLQAGLQLAQTLGIPDFAWRCQFSIGVIAEEQEKPKEAITHYKQAVETIESMREKLQTKEMQAGFMRVGDKTKVYERLIKLLIELGREEEALEYLERSKSEILREALGRVIPQVEDAKVREILEKIEQLENKADATASRLVEARSNEEVENLKKLLMEIKGKVSEMMTYLEQHHSEIYQHLAFGYDELDVIQQRIPPNTLLVEYCVMPEETYLFLITRKSFSLKSVKVNREELNSWVLDYREEIQHLNDVSELSSKLYGILIKPIEKEISSVQTITIVPYGLLYYLPFHALERTTEIGERQFLIQWKRVSYLTKSSYKGFAGLVTPSADRPPKPLVAFGNPDGTLEGAFREVMELKAIIPDATVYVLDDAKKQVFLDTAGDYQWVQLATHTHLDSDPTLSYLVLAPKDSGNLTMLEIAGLVELFSKHRSVVVLSACDTAVEKMKKENKQGKAVMSLAFAFARAGSPTLIASLWQVSDESTQKLMTAFYRALNDGQGDILDALRQAQLKVMQTEGWDDKAGVYISYAHPHYWAPFLLIGKWQQ